MIIATPPKKLNTHSHHIWLAAFLLAILVVISAAVVGGCLYAYVHRSDCVISLYEGNVTVDEQNSPQKTASILPQNSPIVQSKATQYRGSQASGQAAKYGFKVEDTQQVWQTDTSVDLFKSSYSNKDGKVTVSSANGDNVIAPGTSGKYTFTLKNAGTKAADYKVWVETEISSNIASLPFQIKMSGNDGWLLGGKNAWEQMSELDGVSLTERVDAGKTADYTFYWQWPFEQGDDEADTLLGNAGDWTGGSQDLTYTVTIHTLASESASQSDSGNGKENSLLKAVKTGDDAPVALWCAGMAGAVCVIGWLIWLKKKKKEER